MKLSDLRRFLAPLEARVRSMLVRGVVTRVDDTKQLQELQVRGLAGAVHDRVEHFHPWGLTGVPPEGSEALLVHVGGAADHPIALAANRRSERPRNLSPGETILYSADGDFLHLKSGHAAHLVTEDAEVDVDTLVIDAGSSIRLVCGDSEVLIEPSKITITSPQVDFETP